MQSLLLHAISLSEEGEHPLLLIHSTRADMLIQHADGYTTAIARTSTAADELQAANARIPQDGNEAQTEPLPEV